MPAHHCFPQVCYVMVSKGIFVYYLEAITGWYKILSLVACWFVGSAMFVFRMCNSESSKRILTKKPLFELQVAITGWLIVQGILCVIVFGYCNAPAKSDTLFLHCLGMLTITDFIHILRKYYKSPIVSFHSSMHLPN